jgi:hypothetical protein
LELFMGIYKASRFLQDGTLCHKAKIMTKWFAEASYHPDQVARQQPRLDY